MPPSESSSTFDLSLCSPPCGAQNCTCIPGYAPSTGVSGETGVSCVKCNASQYCLSGVVQPCPPNAFVATGSNASALSSCICAGGTPCCIYQRGTTGRLTRFLGRVVFANGPRRRVHAVPHQRVLPPQRDQLHGVHTPRTQRERAAVQLLLLRRGLLRERHAGRQLHAVPSQLLLFRKLPHAPTRSVSVA